MQQVASKCEFTVGVRTWSQTAHSASFLFIPDSLRYSNTTSYSEQTTVLELELKRHARVIQVGLRRCAEISGFIVFRIGTMPIARKDVRDYIPRLGERVLVTQCEMDTPRDANFQSYFLDSTQLMPSFTRCTILYISRPCIRVRSFHYL